MAVAYLSLGSNLGIKLNNMAAAMDKIRENSQIKILKISSMYLTEPLEMIQQPYFLNQVIKIETDIPPQGLLTFILKTEKELGRKRIIPKGPRIIDIDIISYNEEYLQEEDLILPHPKMTERNFVLFPLLEIEPEYYLFQKEIFLKYFLADNRISGKIKKLID